MSTTIEQRPANVFKDVDPSPIEQIIDGLFQPIDDELGGSVFPSSAVIYPTLSTVLRIAGWVGESGAPDPVRLMNGAKRRSVNVGLVAQANDWPKTSVPGEIYGNLVLQGVHPVGVVYLDSYIHDVSDDHYPAPFVVGQDIFELLRPPGRRPDHILAARSYDYGTVYIRSYIERYISSLQRGGSVPAPLQLPHNLTNSLSERKQNARTDKILSLIRAGVEELELV